MSLSQLIIGIYHLCGLFMAFVTLNKKTYLNLHGNLTEQIDTVVNCTLIRVNNKAKLTNLMINSRIEGYNSK